MKSGRRHLFVWACGMIVAAILVLPTLIVVPISFAGTASYIFPPTSWSTRWYEDFFTDRAWMGALQRSVTIGLLAAALATIFGTAAAIGVSRTRWGRSATGLRLILLSPIVIPGVVLAIGVYTTFLATGLVGTLAGFVVAHTALGIPFVIVSVTAALSAVDPTLQLAAEGLGASRWAVIARITFPLVAPGVAAGFVFAFVTSFDEVVVALFLKSPFLETLPVRMYSSAVNDIDPTIAAASTIVLLLVTIVLVVGAAWMARRSRRMRGASRAS